MNKKLNAFLRILTVAAAIAAVVFFILLKGKMETALTKTKWAQNYWTQTVERLLFQWRQLPILHDGDAVATMIPRWHVNYEFFELSEEAVYGGFFDRLYHVHHSSRPDLDGAWERQRAMRLARAQ